MKTTDNTRTNPRRRFASAANIALVTKLRMQNRHDQNTGQTAGAGGQGKGWPRLVGCLSLAAGLLWSGSVAAVTTTLLGQGQLPSGEFIVMSQLTLNPGESILWHYHPGIGYRVVLSGTATED